MTTNYISGTKGLWYEQSRHQVAYMCAEGELSDFDYRPTPNTTHEGSWYHRVHIAHERLLMQTAFTTSSPVHIHSRVLMLSRKLIWVSSIITIIILRLRVDSIATLYTVDASEYMYKPADQRRRILRASMDASASVNWAQNHVTSNFVLAKKSVNGEKTCHCSSHTVCFDFCSSTKAHMQNGQTYTVASVGHS